MDNRYKKQLVVINHIRMRKFKINRIELNKKKFKRSSYTFKFNLN